MAKAPLNIRSLARQHTEAAIKTLHTVMHQKDAPPAARVQAAQALLDRGWGKPTQHVEADITVNPWQEIVMAIRQDDADNAVH